MSSELEQRLAAALEARAGQVGPEDLAPRELPDPQGRGPARAVWVGLAAAACLAAVGAGVVVPRLLADPDAVPPPASDLEVPPDVGRGWEPVQVGRGVVDLDGDGDPDRLRFRGEPDPDYEGRTRVEAELSGGGSAYGLVSLWSTLSSYAPAGADLDGDGADELVLTADSADPSTTYARVLDLRGDVLVVLPPRTSDTTPLMSGPLPESASGSRDPSLEAVADWWIEDGVLRSSLSRDAYPALGMSWWVPDPYVAQTWTWRVVDDELVPEEAEDVCISRLEDERRPCAPGEQDGLPDLTPVADDLVGAGESTRLTGGLPGTARVVRSGRSDRLVLTPDGGRPTGFGIFGERLRVFAAAPSALVVDELAAAYDEDGDDRPDGVVVATPDGPTTLLRAPDDHRAWLAEDGAVYTVSGESGRVELGQWARDGSDLFVVPLGTVCLPGDGDVSAAERC